MIPKENAENFSLIDGMLKTTLAAGSTYAYQFVKPYYEKHNKILLDHDADNFLKACEFANTKHNDSNWNIVAKNMAIAVAVLMETDNAWRIFIRETCLEYARLENAKN